MSFPVSIRSLGVGVYALGLLTVATLTMHGNGPCEYELGVLTASPLVLSDFAGLVLNADPYHPPLPDMIFALWGDLGDSLGVGGQLLWLRLLNLVFMAIVFVALYRLGRAWLGQEKALSFWGLSATLFILLPTSPGVSICQGYYFMESAFTLLFVEGVVGYSRGRTSRRALVPVFAALALWTGHMAALIVAPGLLVFLAIARRREGLREALLLLLLFIVLYGPMLATGVWGVIQLLEITVPGHDAVPGATVSLMRNAHEAMVHPQHMTLSAFLRGVWEPIVALYGVSAAILAAGLLVVFGLRERRAGALLLVVLVEHGLLYAAHVLRPQNYSSLYPVLLVLPILAFEGLGRLEGRPRRRLLVFGAWLLACLLSSHLPPRASARLAPLDIVFAPGTERALALAGDLNLEEHRLKPFVALTDLPFARYVACPKPLLSSGARTYDACVGIEERPSIDEGYYELASAGRPLLVPRRDSYPANIGADLACRRLRAGAQRYEAMAGTALVLFSDATRGCEHWGRELHERCRLLREVRGMDLFDCPGPGH